MGNAQAASRSNHPSTEQDNKNTEDEGGKEIEMGELGLDSGRETDLSRLFHAEHVHLIASTLRDIKQTVYERCYEELEEALEDLVDAEINCETIDFSRFRDLLKPADLSPAELMQIFNLIDYEGRGSFEAVPVLKALKKNKKITLNDDLNSVLKRLEDCCWMPGFVDAYIDQKDSFREHGLHILNFLLRNRLLSPAVNCHTIESFEGVCRLRERVVESRIKSLEFSSLKDRGGLQSSASLNVQTKSVLEKEGSMSGDHLVPEEVRKPEPELPQDKMHAGDALLLWYTQLVTTTSRACLTLAPELLNMALAHTRTMVSQLLPLSLAHDSQDRPPFLNVDCLYEMGKLIQLFPEKAELLEHSLSFHLACGNMSEILHCLTELNVSTVQIDCSNLLSNLDQVRRRLLQKSTRYLKVDLLGCDAEGVANQDPHSLLETNWKQSAFSTKPGEMKANFVFECSEWTAFTKIKIKVGNEKSAPSHGFIFVLAKWPVDAGSDLKKELERFSMYDSWTEFSYKSLLSNRLITGNGVTNNPVAYFSTKDRDEVEVWMDNPVIGKFIVVKFLEPREKGVDHLGIMGIKFYGVPLTTSIGHLELQISRSLSTANPLESNQMAIQSVLRFLLLVFCCQVKEKQAVVNEIYNFSKKICVKFDKNTGILSYDPEVTYGSYSSTVLAKMPFTKDCPYFEIEIANHARGGAISVGAAPSDFQNGQLPGWTLQSYGYHSFDGRLFVDRGPRDRTRQCCTTGDRMGCGVEFEDNQIKLLYFTKNGERVHEYVSNVINAPGGLFPAIGLEHCWDKVRLLNNEPWRFSDDEPVEKVRRPLVASGSDFLNPNHLDLSNVSIDILWKTFKQFPEKTDQSHLLQLIHSTLPHLKSKSSNLKTTSEIFDHLCYLLDHGNDSEEDDMIIRSAKDLIRDGLDLFFPNEEARPKMLLDLLQESSESSLTCSKLILFQSLCHYFSTVNVDILMPLPTKTLHQPEDFNSSNPLTIMGKLLSISFRDSLGLFQLTPETDGSTVNRKSLSVGSETLSGRKKSEHLFHLSKLLNKLQMRLFAWVSQELSKPQEATDDVERLEKLIIHYCCDLITPKAEHFLTRMKMLKESDLRVLLRELDTSFLVTTLRELILLLSELATKLSSHHKAKLLENLKPVMTTIRKLLFRLPDLLPSLGENQGTMEKELRTWEVDSPLTNRPDKLSLTYSCNGATHFEVEFNERCETSKGFEVLDFGDTRGNHRRFSGKVGRGKWPMKARFDDTSAIYFTYSNLIGGDTTCRGYNFKLKAMQTKVSDFHWLYDIYLSFCRLLGRIAVSVFEKTPVFPKSSTLQDKLEMQLYESELWTTIFRGGLFDKKIERSLSGNYETADQSEVATFLNTVAELKSEKAKAFINRCKSHHNRNHDIGGEEIDRVIVSVFAALLWHTQSLRHDVNIYLLNEFVGKISDGIHEAYAAAENLRLLLAERRQTMRKELKERLERGEEEGSNDKEAAVDVVHLVEEKSKFLLQFSGLSNIGLKAEEIKKKFETRRSRQQSTSPRLSHETSVDISISVASKYPSFRLVFDFVQDIAWTKDKVEELLKKRYTNSETLWKTYSFMSEFFRTASSEPLENDISCTVFIRELLAAQDKFGRHYADGIDGCGLGMEANVRKSYYGLIRHLVTLLRKDMTASSNKSKPVGSEVLATCILHLLDIDWQACDLPFMVELHLPELYFTLVKDNLLPVFEDPLEEFGVDDTEEEYRRNREWAMEARSDSHAYTLNRCKGADIRLAKHIRARYQKLDLGMDYNCDGCRADVSMDYYRCLDCDDVDICKKCYDGELIPQAEAHNGEHSLVLFRYVCKGCTGFITATRWHCNECDDFDLCNGCHSSNKFPARGSDHNRYHSVSKKSTPRVHQGKKFTINDPMSAYFHLHSWMLFSNTALSALDFLTSEASEGKVQRVDENYMYAARQLYSNCLETAVDYLIPGLPADKADSNQAIASFEAAATQMNSLVEVSEPGRGSLVSKIIGLIAALISPENQSLAVKEVTEVLTSEKCLVALFDIARAEKVHRVLTRHMALGLLGKLLQQLNTSSEACPSLQSSESGEMIIVDPKAMNLLTRLFEFGADCLTRHGLELAKSTSQVLNGLQMNPAWTQLLNHQFFLSVDLLHSSPTLSSIFALFAFTGFPDMLAVGTLVTHVEKNKEVIRSVVRLKKSDEAMCTIVELNSRKTKRMKDTLLDVVTNNKSFLSDNQISQCAKFIINIVNQKVIPGLTVDALSLWQLALIVKSSLQSVHNNKSKVYLQLYDNSFLQCLTHLASLGTDLPKSLLLSDLEVLSLKLNKCSQSEPDLNVEHRAITTIAEEDSDTDTNDSHDDDDDDHDNHDDDDDDEDDDEDDEDDEDTDVGDSVSSSSSKEEDSDLLPTPQTAVSMQVTSANREPAAPKEIIDNIPTEAGHGKKKQRQTMQGKEETDTGIAIGQVISDLLRAEIEIDECSEEVNLEKPSLMSAIGDEDKEKRRKRKEKSSGLVEKLIGSMEEGLLTKVNRALGILYARKLLMALVSECQDDEALKSYINSIFFILPLLVGQEANGTLEKVIMKVVSCCQPNDVTSISVASSFFVAAAAEGQVVTVSKRLPSSLFSSRMRNCKDEVYIPGAIALKVELDKSSCDECDVKLVFSSSSDFTKNKRCFSGRSPKNWEDFTIAGDHLYCTLRGPGLNVMSSNYKFKVTGIVSFSDHLDVGFVALSAIFDKPDSVRLLPVGQLWKLLVNMANRSSKIKRLKTIQLLLKLMSLQTKSRGCEELSVDLSLLKGLWQMYQKMMETTKDSKKVQPALVLALTELFYVAQNVAMEWNVAHSYMTTVEADGSIPRMKSQKKLIEMQSTMTSEML